ncbi:MAG: hypothetical protein SPF57_06990 [Streptococcus orisratti]|uniref:type IV secretory system conjugative DNA transfer family protein n=1 Tax=Streptococcus orisratti TaxID=114652 RepID=UPI002A91EC17|nr:hypothetical protein [Streptococcus orisratti]MDY5636069.1 hypothetical protein [Streptococcus orisratti]
MNLSVILILLTLLGVAAYQIDKKIFNGIGLQYLKEKYTLPYYWEKSDSILKAIYDRVPELTKFKAVENVGIDEKGQFLYIQLSSNIKQEQLNELEGIVKGIIANHQVNWTVDYSKTQLFNAGWFAIFKIETIQQANFNQNARLSDPQSRDTFKDRSENNSFANPLLLSDGTSPNLNFNHALILGGTGTGKSILAMAMILFINQQDPSSRFVISEMKSEDYTFCENLSNVFLGLNALRAIDVAYNELEARKQDKSRERFPYYLVIEELTALFEVAGKEKKAYQEKVRVLLYTGRAFNIRLLVISQDLLANALGEGSARNQFSLLVALGALRSSVTKGLFELEEGQILETNIPKGYGYLQRFDDGSPVKQVKIRPITDFDMLRFLIMGVLSKPMPITKSVDTEL